MSARPITVRVADLFCGAGGSSTGAERALRRMGKRMQLVAVNHWQRAIATHKKNHPGAVHVCADMFGLDPRKLIDGGALDLLLASPTCTHHSRARGGKPVSRDQKYGRMTPTQVYRWATELDVPRMIVENVPEFTTWGPYDWCPTHRAREYPKGCPEGSKCRPVSPKCREAGCELGKLCRRRSGVYFRAWCARLRRAGWHLEHRILNAADYGDATTRERFFMLGRRDPKRRPCAWTWRKPSCACAPIRWPEPTHSRDGSGDLFGGGRERWRAAREVIDWTLVGRSIFDRPQGPLSPKTLSRIRAGAVELRWGEDYVAMIDHHMATGEDPRLDPRWRSSPDAESAHAHAPFLLSRHVGGAPRSVDAPTPTQVAKHSHLLLEPMVTVYNGQSGHRPVSEPLPTVTTRDRFALVAPLTHGSDTSRRHRSVAEPLPTITGANRGELALVMRTDQHGSNGKCWRPTSEPLATATTNGGLYVAEPVMPAAFGERPGQAPRFHRVSEPVPTIPAQGRVNLATPVEGQRGRDVLYRMLTPGELAGAMSFNDEGEVYRFTGTKTERVKQIGNAVPVRTSSALVAAIMGDA